MELAIFEAWESHKAEFTTQTLAFLSLIFRGLGLGLLISVPTGIILSRYERAASSVLSVLALFQTMPSLALLGFCVSVFAVFGPTAAIVAAVVYSIFPIVLNTYTGIKQVDPRIRDAALGMGMTDRQLLWQVDLPLALPVVMAGVRTGAVYAIGMITICSIVGAGGLGDFVIRGMSEGNNGLILLGIIPILVITMCLFGALSGIAYLSRRNSNLGLLLGGGAILLMADYAITGPVTRICSFVFPRLFEAIVSLQGAWSKTSNFWRQTFIFVSLAIRGIGLALLVGLPIGIFLTRFPRLAAPLITAAGLLQTVPSLALLGVCVTLFSFLFGPTAAVFATVVYSLFPILLNTYTGITQVDPRIRDAARGMGMTPNQILLQVELPLAMPVIIAGVRTSAIYAFAMVTIATFVGSRGLGDFINNGMTREDNGLIMLGVIPILILSFTFFWILGGIANLARKRPSMGQLVGTVMILVMSTYAVAEPFLRPKPAEVRIGAKNFIENLILAHIMRIMVEQHTDLTTEMFPNLGSNYAYKSLLAEQLDLYPEYTGTILMAKDGLNYKKLPPRSEITEIVRNDMRKRFDLDLFETFGLNNTYAVIVKKTYADKHGLETIGDLAAVPEAKVIVDQVFLDRADGWPGLIKDYDLKFKNPPRQVNPDFLYVALKKGNADVVVGFATDYQLATYKHKDKLMILDDNKEYFPSYHGAPLVNRLFLSRLPWTDNLIGLNVGHQLGFLAQTGKRRSDELPPVEKPAERFRAVLDELHNQIDDETMQRLNSLVANKDNPIPADKVARDFLKEKGLID